MTAPLLFDPNAQAEARARARATGMFLQELACAEIIERLKAVNRQFKSVTIVTGFPESWSIAFPSAKLVPDEDLLELSPGQHDLVIHAMALHHCNDPIGQVVQCGRALKPDGLFMGVCFGGQTLTELRSALSIAETDLRGGLSPRITPMAEIRELGALLQRAGLALPVADSLKIPTSYCDIYHLMHDLRDMGETNIMTARQKTFTCKSLFDRAQEVFAAEFPSDGGRIACTFDLVFLSGWAPHASQPKALKPGSVTKSLQQALEEAKSSLGN
ncbi:methyltransferase domain-containing protein [Planktomarina sp.]|uniref:methyltransferase domain-containing protein n=1 Tax=Planktomarina sp. TaxID=2024851 RepID=UPI003C557F5A